MLNSWIELFVLLLNWFVNLVLFFIMKVTIVNVHRLCN